MSLDLAEWVHRRAVDSGRRGFFWIGSQRVSWELAVDQALLIESSMSPIAGREIAVVVSGNRSPFQYLLMLSCILSARPVVVVPEDWNPNLIRQHFAGKIYLDWRSADTQPILSRESPLDDKIEVPLGTIGMFTSGSTGFPKVHPVLLSSFEDFSRTAIEKLRLTETDIIGDIASGHSSLSISNYFLAIACGGCWAPIVGIGEVAKAPDVLASKGATFFRSTISAFQASGFRSNANGKPIRILAFGGEPMPGAFAREILQSGQGNTVISTYGLTETAGWVLSKEISREDAEFYSVPLGEPIMGVKVLSPLHADQGELIISSTQVALAPPYGTDPRERILATKDIVRRLGSNLYFVGRTDRMFKVKGHSVYPEYWETIAANQFRTRIVVFLGPSNTLSVVCEGTSENSVIERVRSLFPPSLSPAYIGCLSPFPLLPSGKVDVRQITQQGRDV